MRWSYCTFAAYCMDLHDGVSCISIDIMILWARRAKELIKSRHAPGLHLPDRRQTAHIHSTQTLRSEAKGAQQMNRTLQNDIRTPYLPFPPDVKCPMRASVALNACALPYQYTYFIIFFVLWGLGSLQGICRGGGVTGSRLLALRVPLSCCLVPALLICLFMVFPRVFRLFLLLPTPCRIFHCLRDGILSSLYSSSPANGKI